MNERPTFSLIHTTARPVEPQGGGLWWRSAHDAWLHECVSPKDVEYVVTVDKADEDRWPGFPPSSSCWGRTIFAVNEKRACPVDGWNKAAEVSSGHFLITVSDDILPCKRWDEAIRKAVPDMTREAVLDVNCGPKALPGFMFFSFLTRVRYEKLGYVFYPEYLGYKGDDDFTAEAYRDGVVVRARHLSFAHLHPSYGLGALDEVYRRQKSRDAHGTKVFNRRWGARTWQDYVIAENAKYIVRSKPAAPKKQVAVPGGSASTLCPKCFSPQVGVLMNGVHGQMRCGACSLIFPAPLLSETRPQLLSEEPPSSVESLRREMAHILKRLDQLETQMKQIRTGEPVKGVSEWSESALRN